jgi:hypothetical protein
MSFVNTSSVHLPSFADLPDELLLLILDKLEEKNIFIWDSRQFVMLHVNKFCARNTTKWFNEKQKCHKYNMVHNGIENLICWACSYKKKEPLSLIKWAEQFSKNFTAQCFENPIKNNNKALIEYLIFEKKCPVNEKLLGCCILYNKKELFDYFLGLEKYLPDCYDKKYFSINSVTLPFIVKNLAITGCYNMLKKYLKIQNWGYESICSEVIQSKHLHEAQKLKIIKLLHNNNIGLYGKYSAAVAVRLGYNNILKWIIDTGVLMHNIYYSACMFNNTKAILLLLDNNIIPTEPDIYFIEDYIENLENKADKDLIIEKLKQYL